MEMAKVTSKGQITIPVSIRRRLNINEGDNLLFIDRPEGVVMVNPDMLPGGQAEPKTPKPAKRAAAGTAVDNAEKPESVEKPESTERPESTEKPEYVEKPEPGTSAQAETNAGTRAAPPATEPSKPDKQLQGLDLNELLNEIRIIGSNI